MSKAVLGSGTGLAILKSSLVFTNQGWAVPSSGVLGREWEWGCSRPCAGGRGQAVIPATDSTASTLAANFKKDFKSGQSWKMIAKMPNPFFSVSKLLHLPDTSAPLICSFAPSPFPIPNSPWKAAHRSQPKKNTAKSGPYAPGGFSKNRKGCGAWTGGHEVGAKASTPKSPTQSQLEGSYRTERWLKRSWRAEQGHLSVHRKKLLCKLHHKKPCTNSALSSRPRERKADDEETQGKASISRGGHLHSEPSRHFLWPGTRGALQPWPAPAPGAVLLHRKGFCGFANIAKPQRTLGEKLELCPWSARAALAELKEPLVPFPVSGHIFPNPFTSDRCFCLWFRGQHKSLKHLGGWWLITAGTWVLQR